MSTADVPQEVWEVVAENLFNPIPLPLSKPPRSAIRQKDLVNFALVCKIFSRAVKPVLYAHIVTDNLPRLMELEHLNKRGVLFNHHTKSLWIEYACKEQSESSYMELFDRRDTGAWRACGLTEMEKVARKQEACQRELKEYDTFLDGYKRDLPLKETGELFARPMCVGAHFPKVTSVSVSSIYGHDPNAWDLLDAERIRQLAENHIEITSPLLSCSIRFTHFLRFGSTIRHLCVRDMHGPLSISEFVIAPKSKSSPNKKPFEVADVTTMHFTLADIPRLPIILDGPSRWAYDGTTETDWNPILSALGQRFEMLRIQRSRLLSSDPSNLSIYCSTAFAGGKTFHAPSALFPSAPTYYSQDTAMRDLSLSEQTRMTRDLQKYTSKYTRVDPLTPDRSNDSLTWQVSASTPTCEACGSGVPTASEE